MLNRLITILSLLATLGVAMAFNVKQPQAHLAVHFHHYVGDEILQFDSLKYKNALGQLYGITKFKYYIGDIRMKRANGSTVALGHTYFLVDEEEETSKKISLDLPAGDYTGIDFIIGVDSIHNCSGAQSGALDPINGMFWTWNTGYIFLKLEGKSSHSTAPGHIFEYHIGGYNGASNSIRRVTLDFKDPILVSGEKELRIKVDAAEILKTPTAIDFSKMPSVTEPFNAAVIANNYIDMFSILQIDNAQ